MATHSSILAWRIPMDRGAWWATVHRVAMSWTRLKWLSMVHIHIHGTYTYTWYIYMVHITESWPFWSVQFIDIESTFTMLWNYHHSLVLELSDSPLETLYPGIVTPHFSLFLAPDNHRAAFCLYRCAYSDVSYIWNHIQLKKESQPKSWELRFIWWKLLGLKPGREHLNSLERTAPKRWGEESGYIEVLTTKGR